ncbi:unnamed protein product, partial [Ilex paraguariensis]
GSSREASDPPSSAYCAMGGAPSFPGMTQAPFSKADGAGGSQSAKSLTPDRGGDTGKPGGIVGNSKKRSISDLGQLSTQDMLL